MKKQVRKYLIDEIDWETDGETWKGLPKSLFIWVDAEEDDQDRMDGTNNLAAADYMTNEFNYFLNCLSVKEVPFENDGNPGEYRVLSEYKRRPAGEISRRSWNR